MREKTKNLGLTLANDLAAKDRTIFTFEDAQQFLKRPSGATANVLRRMLDAGLVDRVKRGHYVIRPLGVLGTSAAAESTELAVGAAFRHRFHRIGYSTGLCEHDLTTQPIRSIHVAAMASIGTNTLCARPLHVVLEPEHIIGIGAEKLGESWVSDIERTLLDCAHRPNLIGGARMLLEAVATAAFARQVDADKLMRYAHELNWASAVRRIGSLADTLELGALSNALKPIRPIRGDLELEPGCEDPIELRDPRWHMRWRCSIDEFIGIIEN